MIHLLRKVENEPVRGKKKINTYLLLLFSNYLMTLSTVLRIMQFEEAHTGLLCKIVQNSLYFCAGQERASEHTKGLKTHVMLARFAQRPLSTAISPLQLLFTWCKTALLESKSRTGTSQTKNITISSYECLLFVLSLYDFCSLARRFSTTLMASCKGPIHVSQSRLWNKQTNKTQDCFATFFLRVFFRIVNFVLWYCLLFRWTIFYLLHDFSDRTFFRALTKGARMIMN